MRIRNISARLRLAACAFASAGLLLPQTPATAQESAGTSSPPTAGAAAAVEDVALAPGGVLQGQVCDAAGLPIAGAEVSVWASGQQVATAQVDRDGHFLIRDLRGGTYTIFAGENGGLYRLWTENAAPPHAVSSVLIVRSGVVERGQNGVYRRWPRSTTLALMAFLGGIVAGGVIGQANSSGS